MKGGKLLDLLRLRGMAFLAESSNIWVNSLYFSTLSVTLLDKLEMTESTNWENSCQLAWLELNWGGDDGLFGDLLVDCLLGLGQ